MHYSMWKVQKSFRNVETHLQNEKEIKVKTYLCNLQTDTQLYPFFAQTGDGDLKCIIQTACACLLIDLSEYYTKYFNKPVGQVCSSSRRQICSNNYIGKNLFTGPKECFLKFYKKYCRRPRKTRLRAAAHRESSDFPMNLFAPA